MATQSSRFQDLLKPSALARIATRALTDPRLLCRVCAKKENGNRLPTWWCVDYHTLPCDVCKQVKDVSIEI